MDDSIDWLLQKMREYGVHIMDRCNTNYHRIDCFVLKIIINMNINLNMIELKYDVMWKLLYKAANIKSEVWWQRW